MNTPRLNAIPIEDVANHIGIRVKRHSALCPFHDDHHPSFVFNIHRNTWRCYVCDIWGGPIDLVMRCLGLDFKDACRWLQHEFCVDADDIADVLKRVKKPAVKKKATQTTPTLDIEVLETIVNAAGLSPEACRFLFDERRYSPEVVRRLKIGSVSNEEKLIKFLEKRFSRERLLKSGLVVSHKGVLTSYFHAPCLLFPYFDRDGQLVNVQARYLGDTDVHPRFQFPRGSETHVYNLADALSATAGDSSSTQLCAFDDSAPIYLAEGVTDCIAHLSAGHRAVAIPSATLLKARDIIPLAGRKLVMMPDNDAPGQRLYEKVKSLLETTGTIVMKEELPPSFKDFSEFYSKSLPNDV